jgi:hypothetical protein
MAEKKNSKAAEAATADVANSIDIETPIVLVEKTNATHLNTLAVVSIATSATGFGAVAGIITGHVALAQIRHTAQKGRGLAITGLIAGYAGLAGFALMGALAAGGHWAENRYDGHRGPGQFMTDGQGPRDGQFGGMMGGHFGRDGQVQGQSGEVQVAPGQGGTITLDGNGSPTITLPDGQTITIPDNGGMPGPGDFGRGPGGMMGGKSLPGNQGQVPSTPIAPDQQKN